MLGSDVTNTSRESSLLSSTSSSASFEPNESGTNDIVAGNADDVGDASVDSNEVGNAGDADAFTGDSTVDSKELAGDSNDVAGNAAAFAGNPDGVTGDSNEVPCNAKEVADEVPCSTKTVADGNADEDTDDGSLISVHILRALLALNDSNITRSRISGGIPNSNCNNNDDDDDDTCNDVCNNNDDDHDHDNNIVMMILKIMIMVIILMIPLKFFNSRDDVSNLIIIIV